MDRAIGFHNTYPLDSDLSGGYRYPTFDQLGPGAKTNNSTISFRENRSRHKNDHNVVIRKGLNSFNKYNSGNFLVKKKVQCSFPGRLFLEKYVKKKTLKI